MIVIEEKKNCCGCTACAAICPKQCIEMRPDKEGFLYPSVDTYKCIQCGACNRVCPVKNCKDDAGASPSAYIVRHKDEKVLLSSTSGGAFTAIADYVLSKGGVVFGAGYDSQFKVIHTYVEDKEQLSKFRNSKYVQSEIGNTYNMTQNFLNQGRKVLFSGTPCQIEGLYSFLHGHTENLVLVDIACHGVPSPLVWERYKECKAAETRSAVVNALFRDKKPYGYDYSQMSLEFENGMRLNAGIDTDEYLRAFFSDICDRPSCYACKFKKTHRVSDLTIWDAFDVYKFDRSLDDNKGATKVLAHTAKGKTIIDSIAECYIKEISVQDAVRGVKELVLSVSENPRRNEFFEDCNRLPSDELFKKYWPITTRTRVERWIRITTKRLGIYGPIKKCARKLLNRV